MTSLVLGDLILESLTPSVNAPLVKVLPYLQVWFIKSYTFISATDSILFDLVPWPLSLHLLSDEDITRIVSTAIVLCRPLIW
jgi:hypothetical protein